MPEIVEIVGALREIMRPVVPRLEGKLVKMTGRIDRTSGIGVFQPCPADIGVLFEDFIGYVGAFEVDRRADARDAPMMIAL